MAKDKDNKHPQPRGASTTGVEGMFVKSNDRKALKPVKPVNKKK